MLIFATGGKNEEFKNAMNKPLTIYRASAGSGKTYTLTKEYIKLLLRKRNDDDNNKHRCILAVTFTNKATEEMKSRIVKNLYKLSQSEDQKLCEQIVKETGISENDIPDLAKVALEHLLHDFSHFSIFTIDSFFQRVIRSFAREMNLYSGYEVELDQNSTLDKATDLMLNDIENNHFLKNWLVEWAKRKIDEGKSWNPKMDMLKLGSEIFKEEVQNIDTDLLSEITDKESLEDFRVKLQDLVNNYWNYLKGKGQEAKSIMANHGLTVDSFSYKDKGFAKYFFKFDKRKDDDLQPPDGKRIQEALAGVEGWFSKSSPKSQQNAVIDAYEGGLNDILHQMYDFQRKNAREATTAVVILKQINVLGVLQDLMKYVSDYARDQNRLLISESSLLLNKIIDNSDTPFIYERIGNYYDHFMIDEFQDTSSIQWNNFYPLIANSVASNNNNLLVGDVKQSIYRWRNTDWRILSEKVERDRGLEKYVQVQNLGENWRSAPNIIDFNNAFFNKAVEQTCFAFLEEGKETDTEEEIQYLNSLVDELKKAYCSYFQTFPDGRKNEKIKGYVHLEMMIENEGSELKWRDKVLNELPNRIEQLLNKGYGLSDIAILVRSRDEAKIIADQLLKNHYHVLSNESLLICNSSAVKWLTAAMRYIVDPDDMINLAFLKHEYETYLSQDLPLNLEFLTSNLRSLPVYELSDKLINQYDLSQHATQTTFLQAFQDILMQYTRRETTDIRSFLDWWDIEKEKKYVAMPENQEAIRLLTIHKSKGAEFEAVIIPFCDWELCKSGVTLWCESDREPFSDIKRLPLKFTKELPNTIFVKAYQREKMMSYIDNLNLLYVAFTRAKKALFISMPQQTKEGFSFVKDLMCRCFNDLSTEPSSDDNDAKNFEIKCYELGELEEKEHKSQIEKEFPKEEKVAKRSFKPAISHIIRNGANFSVDNTQKAKIDKGVLLHDIFRKMVTVADLDQCLNAMIIKGKLPETERAHIIEAVHQALNNPTVKEWFVPNMKVKTESEILLSDGSIARPDRIVIDKDQQAQVIDYKFGETIHEMHRKQVLQYMEHLHKMGFKSVKGFVWYVILNQIVECNF